MIKTPGRVMLLLVLSLLAAPVTSVFAADPIQPVTQYPVPGSPYRVAVEQPGQRLGHVTCGECDNSPGGNVSWRV